LMATVLGGWQLNGIFTWQTGTPLTITADPATCACPGLTPLASYAGGPASVNGMLNPAAFFAGPGFGNLNPGALRGPGSRVYDLALFKAFKVTERYKAELRGEAYNLTNSPVFANPITNINAPNFGQSVSTENGAYNGAFGREIKLGLRILF
jgi:hypothetical protein